MSDTTRTRAPRGYRREGGRFIENKPVESVEAEPFFAPSVEVIVARKRNTTWHVTSCRTSQAKLGKSAVVVADESRLASAPSGVKAAQSVLDIANQRHAMAVVPPIEEPLFAAVCPTHGVIRRNSTVDYAIESAYWHALAEHDAVAS
jgi:uncharacterized protein (DUF2461 family)